MMMKQQIEKDFGKKYIVNNTQLKNLLYGRAIPLVRSYDISYPLKDTASYVCMT